MLFKKIFLFALIFACTPHLASADENEIPALTSGIDFKSLGLNKCQNRWQKQDQSQETVTYCREPAYSGSMTLSLRSMDKECEINDKQFKIAEKTLCCDHVEKINGVEFCYTEDSSCATGGQCELTKSYSTTFRDKIFNISATGEDSSGSPIMGNAVGNAKARQIQMDGLHHRRILFSAQKRVLQAIPLNYTTPKTSTETAVAEDLNNVIKNVDFRSFGYVSDPTSTSHVFIFKNPKTNSELTLKFLPADNDSPLTTCEAGRETVNGISYCMTDDGYVVDKSETFVESRTYSIVTGSQSFAITASLPFDTGFDPNCNVDDSKCNKRSNATLKKSSNTCRVVYSSLKKILEQLQFDHQPQLRRYMAGKVGDAKISGAELSIADDMITGRWIYEDGPTYLSIKGQTKPDGTFEMKEYDGNTLIGIINGKSVQSDILRGTYRKSGQGNNQVFEMKDTTSIY